MQTRAHTHTTQSAQKLMSTRVRGDTGEISIERVLITDRHQTATSTNKRGYSSIDSTPTRTNRTQPMQENQHTHTHTHTMRCLAQKGTKRNCRRHQHRRHGCTAGTCMCILRNVSRLSGGLHASSFDQNSPYIARHKILHLNLHRTYHNGDLVGRTKRQPIASRPLHSACSQYLIHHMRHAAVKRPVRVVKHGRVMHLDLLTALQGPYLLGLAPNTRVKCKLTLLL